MKTNTKQSRIAQIRGRMMSKKALAGKLLANDDGMNHSVEVLMWCVIVFLVGGGLLITVNAFLPDLFTSIGTKITEMLNTVK